jgi:hypothetical protein
MLTGAQINELIETKLTCKRIKNPSDKFIKALRAFVEDI